MTFSALTWCINGLRNLKFVVLHYSLHKYGGTEPTIFSCLGEIASKIEKCPSPRDHSRAGQPCLVLVSFRTLFKTHSAIHNKYAVA
jgi:hypothetical protein